VITCSRDRYGRAGQPADGKRKSMESLSYNLVSILAPAAGSGIFMLTLYTLS